MATISELAADLLVDVRRGDGVQIVLAAAPGARSISRSPCRACAARPPASGWCGRRRRIPFQISIALSAFCEPLLGGARHLDPHRHPTIKVGLGLLGLRQDPRSCGSLVPRRVVRAVELDHLAVGGVELADAAEERTPRCRPGQRSCQKRVGQLDQQRDVVLAALGARGRLQNLGRLGPGLGLAVSATRTARRARGSNGVRLERLAEVRRTPRGRAPAAPIARRPQISAAVRSSRVLRPARCAADTSANSSSRRFPSRRTPFEVRARTAVARDPAPGSCEARSRPRARRARYFRWNSATEPCRLEASAGCLGLLRPAAGSGARSAPSWRAPASSAPATRWTPCGR